MSESKYNRKKILIASLALSGAIILLVGIFSVGKKENLFTSTYELHTVFRDISGLKIGNYARFAGGRAGVVTEINFVNDSVIVITIKIDKKFQRLIEKNAVVHISTEGLVGGKLLDIKPGAGISQQAADGDTLRSINPFDTQEIIEKLLTTNDNASVITTNLASLSLRLNKKKGILEEIISDSLAADNFRQIMQNLELTSRQLTGLSAKVGKIVSEINLNEGLAGKIMHDTALANNFSNTVNNLDVTSRYALKIAREIEESTNRDPSTKNTVNMLLRDTSFSESLKRGVLNLEQGTKKLNESIDALQKSKLLGKLLKDKPAKK